MLEVGTPIVETFELGEGKLGVEELTGGSPVTLVEGGFEDLFFVGANVTCLAGFRGSSPNVLKM